RRARRSAFGRSFSRRTTPTRFVNPEIRRRSTRSTPLTDGGTDEEDDVHGIGAYCRADGIAGERIAHDKRTAELTDDSIRSRRIRRLSRRNGEARVPARLTRLATVRRQKQTLSSARRARLDQTRSANSNLVN